MQTALFECACGKGTYIRAIARDLGERLGCHGHVTSLRRTRVGPFAKDDMVTLETLEAAAEQGREALLAHLLALQSALPDMPRVEVGAQDAAMLGRGQAVLMRGRDAPVLTGPVCVMFEDRALALGECVAGSIHPRRVFQYS